MADFQFSPLIFWPLWFPGGGGGVYSQKSWVGVSSPLSKTLTLLLPKFEIFVTLIYLYRFVQVYLYRLFPGYCYSWHSCPTQIMKDFSAQS